MWRRCRAKEYVPNKAVRLTPTMVAELLPLATLTAISAGWHPFDSSSAAKATLVLAATVARLSSSEAAKVQ